MPGDDYVQTALVMAEAGAALAPTQPRSACYLLGYVAECTLKAAAVAALTKQGIPPADAKQGVKGSPDLSRLATLHRLIALTPSARLRRLAPLDRLAPRMSARLGPSEGAEEHWHPNHRYDGSRWDDQAARDYLVEAERMTRTLIGLRLEGAL
ncbi:MAG: hypothetical protein IPO67_01295 [Deltaproteobacteria bacterium]|nr:hypothetical protein [Deltaproteobacteria bacterium]